MFKSVPPLLGGIRFPWTQARPSVSRLQAPPLDAAKGRQTLTLPDTSVPAGRAKYPAAFTLASASTWLFWMFRIAVAAEFIGHGAFGIITKPGWVPYFGVFGISPEWAYRLMPIVGSIDITLGILILLRPCRAALLYMTFWGLMTSLLRPLSGESWYETLERASNYGVPLAFLLFSGWGRTAREWFAPIDRPALRPETARVLAVVLRLTTGLLLIGHGGYGTYLHKPMLVQQVASIGEGHPQEVVTLVGLLEILVGIGIFARPFGPVLLFVAGWKVLTELLYPISGAPIWEFVERGGSYVAPLALYVLLACRKCQGCETGDQELRSPHNALST